MRGSSSIKLLAVLAVIGILVYSALYGLSFDMKRFGKEVQEILPGASKIKLGLDISGGVSATYVPEKEGQVTLEEMQSAKEVMRKRLDLKGLFDANVTTDLTRNWLIVDIPHEKDPEKAIRDMGRTAKIQFKDPDNKVVLEGNDVVSAKPVYGPVKQGMNAWYISLKLSSEGTKKFSEATGRLIGQPISIYLDEQMISAPTVETKIDSDTAIITGSFDENKARTEAALIQSGALPFTLKVLNSQYIGPSVGQKALQISIYAGIIAAAVILLFMIAYYRLPGLVSGVSLTAYASSMVLILAAAGITLTLPGIAGVILSVGMAVDTNVLIFERLKEELRSGKTLKTSLELGFKRAFKAVFDANMTTIIAAVVLLIFGTGPIQGFAWVLLIGVLLSMFTAITLTNFMMKQVVQITGSKYLKAYGA